MQKNSFEQRVINAQYKLNETEDALVDYIKKHVRDVAGMSISELARHIYTVPNTIMRFCKKLGYCGYVELKIELRNGIDDQSVNMSTKSNHQQEWLQRTFLLIDSQRELDIVSQLHRAHKIIFFAVGETAYVASNFAHMFNAINQKTSFVTYENQIIYEIDNEENILIFLVSLSGETAQVLKVGKQAKQKNHYLVTLTHLTKNSLAKMADTALYCYSPHKNWHGYNLTDKMPLFIILNSLFYRYFNTIV
ncbi:MULTISPECIES: MurR/RpiR family transcriptional regulator [unclassified Sporolactobacillus]|uniref:MurR/RpiR family transcriptional regulator n=1 Tax=unclassified Sporolactobacillus TaxID=2628533 RepID=UPI0023679FFF|nr:MurR/RpiR family transcriptional regulator [Sporolactobacillus sp. CQH2019]MDD9147772.1 MurR/RpiR family transcriptional regulator [Sporolactobacillus sp. CQH2019]